MSSPERPREVTGTLDRDALRDVLDYAEANHYPIKWAIFLYPGGGLYGTLGAGMTSVVDMRITFDAEQPDV
jgi:hypothetical protein